MLLANESATVTATIDVYSRDRPTLDRRIAVTISPRINSSSARPTWTIRGTFLSPLAAIHPKSQLFPDQLEGEIDTGTGTLTLEVAPNVSQLTLAQTSRSIVHATLHPHETDPNFWILRASLNPTAPPGRYVNILSFSAHAVDGTVTDPLPLPVDIRVVNDLHISPDTSHHNLAFYGTEQSIPLTVESRGEHLITVEKAFSDIGQVELIDEQMNDAAVGGIRYVLTVPFITLGDQRIRTYFFVRYHSGPYASLMRLVSKECRFLVVTKQSSTAKGGS
jgi:hypothetical protein